MTGIRIKKHPDAGRPTFRHSQVKRPEMQRQLVERIIENFVPLTSENRPSDLVARTVIANFFSKHSHGEREVILDYLKSKSNHDNPFVSRFTEQQREIVSNFYQWAMNGATTPSSSHQNE